jgi:hypothetical protein
VSHESISLWLDEPCRPRGRVRRRDDAAQGNANIAPGGECPGRSEPRRCRPASSLEA